MTRLHLELEILRVLPFSWVMHWLRFYGWVRYWFMVRVRRGAISRMRAFRPEASSRMVHCMAKQYLINQEISNRLAYLLMTRDARDFRAMIDLKGWERLEEALGQGNGVVLLGSHVGIPILLRWYLRTKDYRVYYLVRMGLRRSQSSVDRWFSERLRTRFCFDTDELMGDEALSLQYMKKAYDHLRKNGLIFIVGDGRFGKRKITVTVFGRQVELCPGGITLGLMSGATILPCFTAVDSRPRFQILIQEPLLCPQGVPRSEQLEIMAAAYVSRLEEHVLQHPTNYSKPKYNYVPQLRKSRGCP